MKTIGFLVLKDGQPCGLVNVTGSKKGGVLMPDASAVQFLKRRDAHRAIARTRRVAALLKESLISGWKKVQPLFDEKPFTILPVSKQ